MRRECALLRANLDLRSTTELDYGPRFCACQGLQSSEGRDNFNSEYLYYVSVKNLSSDPLVGESLVIVLDHEYR
jgi:hypothetical protein